MILGSLSRELLPPPSTTSVPAVTRRPVTHPPNGGMPFPMPGAGTSPSARSSAFSSKEQSSLTPRSAFLDEAIATLGLANKRSPIKQRFDEAIASIGAAPSPHASFMEGLAGKVDELVGQLSSQAERVARLELNGIGIANSSDFGSPSSPSRRAAPNFRLEKAFELLSEQQEEIRNLRAEVFHLQSITGREASTPDATSEGHLTTAATNSLELQVRELVLELRKLQEEQEKLASPPSETLRELKDETSHVEKMLQDVRQEKLEVIAMMHSFAIGKDEALQELDAMRRQSGEELRDTLRAARLSAATLSAATTARRQESAKLRGSPSQPQAEVITLDNVVRQFSVVPTPENEHHRQMMHARQQSQQAFLATADRQAAYQQQTAMTPSVPAWGRPPPPAESSRSFSAAAPSVVVSTVSTIAQSNAQLPGVSPGTVHNQAMVSPVLAARSTLSDMRGISPHAADAKRSMNSNVKRFISAGVSPRAVGDRVLSAGGPVMMLGGLRR